MEHHPHLLSDFVEVTATLGDVFTVNYDIAARWFSKHVYASEESGLPRSGRSNYSNNVTPVDNQVHIVERNRIVIKLFSKMLYFNHLGTP